MVYLLLLLVDEEQANLQWQRSLRLGYRGVGSDWVWGSFRWGPSVTGSTFGVVAMRRQAQERGQRKEFQLRHAA